MKTQELLELAALDALGLLDEGERDAFDAAFRTAPPALQAQIRREQTRIAGDDSLLPKVEAPLGLRARVLAAVREAVEAVADRTGSGRLTLLPSRGVSSLWRAGAIGCAAASIVMAVAMFNIRGEFERLDTATRNDERSEYFARDFGPRFENLFLSPRTQMVSFDASAQDVKAQARLMIDPETNTAHLFVRHLPESTGGYALVKLDADGQPVRDESGNIVKLCVIRAEAGSAYQDRIEISPGTPVGLVKQDGDIDASISVLLRGRL